MMRRTPRPSSITWRTTSHVNRSAKGCALSGMENGARVNDCSRNVETGMSPRRACRTFKGLARPDLAAAQAAQRADVVDLLARDRALGLELERPLVHAH